MIKAGISNKGELLVTREHCASFVGSGGLDVLSTPSVLALIEKVSYESVQPLLDPGCTTVGTAAELRHLAASSLGDTVSCASELAEVDGRRLVFHAGVFCGDELVSTCVHERFVVNSERFLAKLNNKK
ncbi:MAG: thioesterase family protein [Oscillospiraceae bacterium]